MATGNASLRKADQTQGGNAKEATITELKFVDDFDYGGRQSEAQAALYYEYEIDGFQRPWDGHASVGPASQWEVVDDGDGIKRANGKDGGLNDSSTAGRWFAALCDAIEAQGLDFDEVLPDNTVRALRGARVTLTNLKYQTVGGDEKEMKVIDSIIELGGGGKKKAGKGGSKGADKSVDVESATEAVILELLDEKSPIKKGDLPTLIGSAAKKNPQVKAMVQLAFKDAFTLSPDRPWDVDKKKGTIAKRDEDDE